MFKLQYQNKDEAVVEEAEPIIDKLQVSHLFFFYLVSFQVRSRTIQFPY